MNIPSLFIRRPVMTTLVMVAIFVFGIVAYRKLPVSDLPTVDYPTISVSASLPGREPRDDGRDGRDAAREIVLRDRGHRQHHVDRARSAPRSVTLQFSLDRDVDAAAQDVNAAISGTLAQLPPSIIPPSYRKQNPAAAPILFFALTAKDMKLSDLDEYAETTIAQRLSMVNGVAQVSVFGSQKYAVRIELDPAQLTAREPEREPGGDGGAQRTT